MSKSVNRSLAREYAFILLFRNLFSSDLNYTSLIDSPIDDCPIVGNEYTEYLYNGVIEKADELNSIIKEMSSRWKLERISKVALVVCRMAIFEMFYTNDVPVGVAISQAVSLTKKYSDESSISFVNGLLSAISKKYADKITEKKN